MDRRSFIKTTAAIASLSAAGAAIPAFAQSVLDKDSDEYWKTIIAQYKVTDEFTNLNAGHWGIMAEPVLEAFVKHTRFINAYSSYYVGRGKRHIPTAENYGVDYNNVIRMLAEKLGVLEEELVLTRGATESMQLLISGYNNIEPGDTVLFSDDAYYSMEAEMRHLKVHRGAKVVEIPIEYPASKQSLIDMYEQGIKDNPGSKLLLLTHMANRTGLIVPLKEITAMARGYGVDVIVDMAHSWGQYDFDFNDQNVDFVGFNLHKWIGAPLGVGLMYIRKDRIGDIDTKSSKGPAGNTDIRNRVQTGTMNLAAVMAVKDALEFVNDIGIEHIDRRFRTLRNRWCQHFINDDRIQLYTPEDPEMYAGITSVRVKKIDDGMELERILLQKYQINTAAIPVLKAVRVAPGLYSSKADMDKLTAALKELA